jgi:hypothetical protein
MPFVFDILFIKTGMWEDYIEVQQQFHVKNRCNTAKDLIFS